MEDKCECYNRDEINKTKNIKKIAYIISLIIFIITFFIVPENWKWLGFLFTILLSCDIILKGIKNIFKFNFEENTLMTIAVIAGFILGEYLESCLVILLYRLGEFLENKIVENSQRNVEDIAKIKEETTNILKEDGNIENVLSKNVQIGQKIIIKPGEKVPLDCIILEGTSNIDTSVITGESKTSFVSKGEKLLSGSINLTNVITAQVEKDYKHSMASEIVDLVYEAANNKGNTEKFITKFSKKYTPAVLIIAIMITIFLSLFKKMGLNDAIKKSLIFLVASCPCSLVISIPVVMFAGIGAIAKKGLLIKGTKHIEDLSKAKIIAFDKTGTLTTGKMVLDRVEVIDNLDKNKVLEYIVNIERMSNHPIAQVFSNLEKYHKKLDIKDMQEISGYGIYAKVDEKEIIIGNEKLLEKYNIQIPKKEEAIYVAIDKKIVAYIFLKENIERENIDIVSNLKKVGVKRIIMLTGDNKNQAEKIAKQLKIQEVYSNLLPQQKQEKILELKQTKDKVIFIGDGINDAPVLASADFGISMGKGAEIANSISDSIFLSNKISKLPRCIEIAKKTMNIAKFNIVFSIAIKIVVILLGFLGLAPIWMAVLADTGVTILTVANALRIRP